MLRARLRSLMNSLSNSITLSETWSVSFWREWVCPISTGEAMTISDIYFIQDLGFLPSDSKEVSPSIATPWRRWKRTRLLARLSRTCRRCERLLKRSASCAPKLILTIECEHHTISQELTLEGFLHHIVNMAPGGTYRISKSPCGRFLSLTQE